jgi:SAM-dependent methyltransferase
MRRALIGALEFASRQLRRATSLVAMLVLAATRRAELQEAISKSWRRYGEDAGLPPLLAKWESDFYDAHLEPASRILLIGCGAGRDLIALAERGHRVDGLDIEPEALAACRVELERRGLRATLYTASVHEARLESPYDAALFSWFVYGYVPGAGERVRTLVRLRETLRPGGRVLLTYQPRPANASRIPAALARLFARVTLSDRMPEHGDFVELLGSGPERSIHFEHRFSGAEIVDEAQRAGLSVRSHEHGRDGRLVLQRD